MARQGEGSGRGAVRREGDAHGEDRRGACLNGGAHGEDRAACGRVGGRREGDARLGCAACTGYKPASPRCVRCRAKGEGYGALWPDGRPRCAWANPDNPAYVAYHDHEWGVPCHDNGRLFELLVLECFQAGLSWECILNKREGFRRAFHGFDVVRIAAFTEEDVNRLMADPSIVRSGAKIRAAIGNARAFMGVQEEFGSFDAYLWGWVDGEPLRETGLSSSPLSEALSRDLKRRGMRFVGPVTAYAFLQAAGVVNSHDECCDLHG